MDFPDSSLSSDSAFSGAEARLQVPSQFKEPGEKICVKARAMGRLACPSWHIAARSLKFG